MIHGDTRVDVESLKLARQYDATQVASNAAHVVACAERDLEVAQRTNDPATIDMIVNRLAQARAAEAALSEALSAALAAEEKHHASIGALVAAAAARNEGTLDPKEASKLETAFTVACAAERARRRELEPLHAAARRASADVTKLANDPDARAREIAQTCTAKLADLLISDDYWREAAPRAHLQGTQATAAQVRWFVLLEHVEREAFAARTAERRKSTRDRGNLRDLGVEDLDRLFATRRAAYASERARKRAELESLLAADAVQGAPR